MFTRLNRRQMFAMLLVIVLVMSIIPSALAFSGSVWRNINQSCASGARVPVSASGSVTATFYRNGSAVTITQNFGGGSSSYINSWGGGSYSGVSVSGNNLLSVGNASCI